MSRARESRWNGQSARWSVLGLLLLGCTMCAISPVHADDAKPTAVDKQTVRIVLRPDATPLETFAAEELKRYVTRLFGKEASIGTEPSDGSIALHLQVTDGSRNGATAQQIRLVPREDGLTIEGGSPQAVLWGVYELVERWGVRYLTSGDVLPAKPEPFRLPEKEIILAPNMKTRCWRLVNDLADGPRFLESR